MVNSKNMERCANHNRREFDTKKLLNYLNSGWFGICEVFKADGITNFLTKKRPSFFSDSLCNLRGKLMKYQSRLLKVIQLEIYWLYVLWWWPSFQQLLWVWVKTFYFQNRDSYNSLQLSSEVFNSEISINIGMATIKINSISSWS